MLQKLENEPKTVGIKQTIKAVNSGSAHIVFVAKDAQYHVKDQIITIANCNNIPVYYVSSMTELGEACNVEVKTATAALIRE